jgi:hypothetical protein
MGQPGCATGIARQRVNSQVMNGSKPQVIRVC